MFIGSLQEDADSGIGGALPRSSNLTTANYSDINEAIDLVGSLGNSAIVTIGVLLGTLFFGLLAGYAMAVLHYRGRGVTFASVLLVQTVPFQLLMIPLYVLLVRNYGLGDTYLGMILPFAIGPAAVFIFRQFFLQLPRELFDAARIDGARRVHDPPPHRHSACPPGHPHGDAVDVHRPVERVPLAVPHHQEGRHATACRVARQLPLQPAGDGGQPIRVGDGRRLRAGGTGRRVVHRVPAPLHVERHRLRSEGVGR